MKLQMTLDERDLRVHCWIYAFEQRVNRRFRNTQSQDMTGLRTEIEQLRSEVTALVAPPAPLPFLSDVQPLVIIDLFAEENPQSTSEKRPRTDNVTLEGCKVRESKKEHREIEADRHASILSEHIWMDRVRQQGIGSSSSRVATDYVPWAVSEIHVVTLVSTPMDPSTTISDLDA